MLPMWVLVGEERKKKSNRSFWDAFELLLIKSICINKSGLSFRYQEDLDEVIKKVICIKREWNNKKTILKLALILFFLS